MASTGEHKNNHHDKVDLERRFSVPRPAILGKSLSFEDHGKNVVRATEKQALPPQSGVKHPAGQTSYDFPLPNWSSRWYSWGGQFTSYIEKL